MKRITTQGRYVLGRRHIIELEAGQECVYPSRYTREDFADRAAIRRKYPDLARKHFDELPATARR